MSAFATNTTAAAAPAATAAAVTEPWDAEKQKDFVERGLKDPATGEYVSVTKIWGVGKVTGEKLADAGFVYAYQLIGMWMTNSMDAEATDGWLENEIRVKRPELREAIISTMQKWCDRHL
jgi:predicted flap endonuclease-1-like 5' DNA nuclease